MWLVCIMLRKKNMRWFGIHFGKGRNFEVPLLVALKVGVSKILLSPLTIQGYIPRMPVGPAAAVARRC